MPSKMKFQTPDLTAESKAKLAKLFPGVVVEGKVNFDLLRSMLGDEVFGDEAYEFTWVGKRAAMEEDMLDFAFDVKDSSRLSCQIKISDGLNGLRVRVPEKQF